jgi:hypothetical protein
MKRISALFAVLPLTIACPHGDLAAFCKVLSLNVNQLKVEKPTSVRIGNVVLEEGRFTWPISITYAGGASLELRPTFSQESFTVNDGAFMKWHQSDPVRGWWIWLRSPVSAQEFQSYLDRTVGVFLTDYLLREGPRLARYTAETVWSALKTRKRELELALANADSADAKVLQALLDETGRISKPPFFKFRHASWMKQAVAQLEKTEADMRKWEVIMNIDFARLLEPHAIRPYDARTTEFLKRVGSSVLDVESREIMRDGKVLFQLENEEVLSEPEGEIPGQVLYSASIRVITPAKFELRFPFVVKVSSLKRSNELTAADLRGLFTRKVYEELPMFEVGHCVAALTDR